MLSGVADSESPGLTLGVVAGAGEAGFPLSSSRQRGAMQARNAAIATGQRGTNDSAAESTAEFTTGTGFAVHPQLLLLQVCFRFLITKRRRILVDVAGLIGTTRWWSLSTRS
jgi:hypothetical protein